MIFFGISFSLNRLKLLHEFPVNKILDDKGESSAECKPLFPQNPFSTAHIKYQQIVATWSKYLKRLSLQRGHQIVV